VDSYEMLGRISKTPHLTAGEAGNGFIPLYQKTMYIYWGVLDGWAGNFDPAKRMKKRSSLTVSFWAAASTLDLRVWWRITYE
jgi:hypothetical protein